MPTFRTGNIWDEVHCADLLLFTGNSFIRNDGRLVMGRGIAHEVLVRYRGCGREFGELIGSMRRYGIVIHPTLRGPKVGVFQVKYFFKDTASLELISYSLGCLRELLAGEFRDAVVFMNFPGIGYGRLAEEQVLPLLSDLPENVYIWKR